MNELLDRIGNYWGKRSNGYCQTNLEEINSFKRQAWIDVISEYAPKVKEDKLKVLDIGTGPGFFSLIMASLGHEVTAIDYTEAMIEKAKSNADLFNQRISFMRMDAQKLEFEENTFDLIISRNLTWNLERPQDAYKNWHRVLKQGGRLLNFDANWYRYLHDEEKRAQYEQDRSIYYEKNPNDNFENIDPGVDTSIMEDIAKELPLSKINRPEWDAKVFFEIGFNKIFIDQNIGDRVWGGEEILNYRSMPMFLIGAEK